MNKNRYSGFTLVEMLVVMGILIILMTMGIAAGRFAIQRANRVQHQNAADQLYQGLQAYYADNRQFPVATGFNFGTELASGGDLNTYMDSASFDGGSDASYYYGATTDRQSVLVCVSFGGQNDSTRQGGYCQGNGFGVIPTTAPFVTTKTLNADDFAAQVDSRLAESLWDGDTKSF